MVRVILTIGMILMTTKNKTMQYVTGIVILFLFGVCIYGIVDIIKQINKIK